LDESAAPFDDWEREAYGDLSDLLDPALDLSPPEPDDAEFTDPLLLPPTTSLSDNLVGGATGLDTSLQVIQEPEAIQDFDLDLLEGPKPELTMSELLLMDLLELEGSSALRNDVMLPSGRVNQTQPAAASQAGRSGVGYLPEEDILHRSANTTRWIVSH
jgi:hypothetical protein